MKIVLFGLRYWAVRQAGSLGVLMLLAACQSPARSSTASVDSVSLPQRPSVVVDSFLPMPELIARFQAASGQRAESLAGGAGSAESLVRRYVEALALGDTLALRMLVVSRSEYAYLIFPKSRLSRPPYELNPEVAWLMLSLESEK